MVVRVNPETGFIDTDTETTYSLTQIASMRVPCPECGALITLGSVNVGNINDQEIYAVGARWSCPNGHGSPDTL